jgi:hypothetical protein
MNYFVFVVCGAAEYIEQLNFSLRYLRYFSKYPIIVVTDNSRNEAAIEHETIVDVKTPENLNHHEASIFLETSLYKYLDLNNNVYFYLDSDMIAIDTAINKVFDFDISPILFALDHCNVAQHSPHATKCDCLKNQLQKNNLFEKAINSLPKITTGSIIDSDRKKLIHLFIDMKRNPLRYALKYSGYIFKRFVSLKKIFHFGNYYFNKTDKTWHNKNGDLIDYDFNYYNRKIRSEYGIFYDRERRHWKTNDGENAEPLKPKCGHLVKHLKIYYHKEVSDTFNHWNCGAFLFNTHSIKIMEFWHKFSVIEMSKNELNTKYIDQVVMTAAVFHFNIMNNKTLPIEYNFIADREQSNTKHKAKIGYTFNDFKTICNPVFLHVYNYWGDENWDIWQSVISLGKKLKIID